MSLLEADNSHHGNQLNACAQKCGHPRDFSTDKVFSRNIHCEGGFTLEYLRENFNGGCRQAIEGHTTAVQQSRCVLHFAHVVLQSGIYIMASNAICATLLIIVFLLQLPRFLRPSCLSCSIYSLVG